MKWGGGETLCIHYGLCMDLLLDNTISILLQWAVFSVLCIKSGCGGRQGARPPTYGHLLFVKLCPRQPGMKKAPPPGHRHRHNPTKIQVGLESGVWRGLDLEPHNVTTRSCQRVNLQLPAPSSAHCCYFCISHECGEMSRDEVTSHHPAAEIVTDCSAQRHSNI